MVRLRHHGKTEDTASSFPLRSLRAFALGIRAARRRCTINICEHIRRVFLCYGVLSVGFSNHVYAARQPLLERLRNEIPVGSKPRGEWTL